MAPCLCENQNRANKAVHWSGRSGRDQKSRHIRATGEPCGEYATDEDLSAVAR